VLMLMSFASIAVHGGLKYGIDFAGGTLVQLHFQNPPAIQSIRTGLQDLNLGESTIQEFGNKHDILIHVEASEKELQEIGSRITGALEKSMGISDIVVERVEMVGPKVGADLRQKAVLSIVYAVIGILIYVSWRFEFQYALAAILALVHDVVITMGVFSVMDKEFTLVIVAAFLTIIGYSLNDTIVVFDRIRENLRRRGKETLSAVINTSINQTLSRTILTGLTTLLVVLALFFLGGEIIHDFSFALILGIIIGTYSSIFIASVFLILWETRTRAKKA